MVQLKELQRRIRLLKNGAVDDSTYAAWLQDFVKSRIKALDYRRALLIDPRFEFWDASDGSDQYLVERFMDAHWEVSSSALGANPMMPFWLETEVPGLFSFLFSEAHQWGDWVLNEFLQNVDEGKVAQLIELVEEHTEFSMKETYRTLSPGENLRGNIESCYSLAEEFSEGKGVDVDEIDIIAGFFATNLLRFIRDSSPGLVKRFTTSTRLFYAIEETFDMKSSPKLLNILMEQAP